MKKTLLCQMAFLSLVIIMMPLMLQGGQKQNYGFSVPILVGGDNPTKPNQTTAVHMGFIKHPGTTGSSNFSSDYEIESKAVDDVVASPGVSSDYSTDMLWQLPGKPGGQLATTNGLGPQGMGLTISGLTYDWSYEMSLEKDGNASAERVIFADIRNAKDGNEFQNLLGMVDPFQSAFIGDASANAPYASGLYPAAPYGKPFQWCAGGDYSMYYNDCGTGEEWKVGSAEDAPYIYDMATSEDGSLIVGASYDNTTLHMTKAEYGVVASALDQKKGDFITNAGPFDVSSASPLVFLKKDTENKRFKLLGLARSYQLDLGFVGDLWTQAIEQNGSDLTDEQLAAAVQGVVLADTNSFLNTSAGMIFPAILQPYGPQTGTDGFEKLANSVMPFLSTNGTFAYGINPTSVKMIKVGSPAKENIAVTYQNTLFSFEDYFLNPYGRPLVFLEQIGAGSKSSGVHNVHMMKELIGLKPPGGTFTAFQDSSDLKGLFPSKVVSPVIFWNPKSEIDVSSYDKSNPSSVYDPYMIALVDPGQNAHPGIYDTAVLTDNKGTAQEKNYLLVPSNKKVSATSSKGMILVIDPADEARRLYMKSWRKDPASAQEVNEQYGEIWLPKVAANEIITKLPMIVPKTEIDLHAISPGNYVPYQIRTGDLDGNPCMDFVVTYRSATFGDAGVAGKVSYDGYSVDFPNEFMIVLRKHTSGNVCGFGTAHLYSFADQLPAAGAKIASAAIGDFISYDKDNPWTRNDIAVGNLSLEYDPESGKYTSFAYIFNNAKGDTDTVSTYGSRPLFTSQMFDPVTGIGVKQIRVGTKSYDSPDAEWGAGYLTVNNVNGSDNLGAISGRPLMLPSIACPTSLDDKKTVISPHEGMLSVLYTRMSETVSPPTPNGNEWPAYLGSTPVAPGMSPPFVKTFGDATIPVPQRCAPRTEICPSPSEMFPGDLPLWGNNNFDCQNTCTAFSNMCDILPGAQAPSARPYVGYGGYGCMPLYAHCMGFLCETARDALIQTCVSRGHTEQECEDVLGVDNCNQWYVSNDNSDDPDGAGEDTEFASRIDRVIYTSDDTAIADMAELENASAGSPSMVEILLTIMYAPTTPMDNLFFDQMAWTSYLSPTPWNENATLPEKPFPAVGCSLIERPSLPGAADFGRGATDAKKAARVRYFNFESIPTGKVLGITLNLDTEMRSRVEAADPILGFSANLGGFVGTNIDKAAGIDLGGAAGGIGFQLPTPPQFNKMRFPRGAGMPGIREMDVVLGPPDHCGDGAIDPYLEEDCDPAAPKRLECSAQYGDPNAVCNGNCKCTYCGDGNKQAGEDCDEGSTSAPGYNGPISSDACRPGCKLPTFCAPGDQVVDGALGEECVKNADCPNAAQGDRCEGCKCIPPECGDGIVQPGAGEQCESDADCPQGKSCDACQCREVCGDGMKGPNEQCESNADCPDGQSCDKDNCTCVEKCGDDVKSVNEQCEADSDCAAQGEGYVCDKTINPCTCVPPPVCGDGIVQGNEECGEVGLSECPEGYDCDANCTCVFIPGPQDHPGDNPDDGTTEPDDGDKPGGKKKPGEKNEPTLLSKEPVKVSYDCQVKCASFPSNKDKVYYDQLNEQYFRYVTGRTDDYFCPMGGMVEFTCSFKDAVNASGKIGPWMMVQSKGMVLHDIGLITKDNYPLDVVDPSKPLRVAPVNATEAASAGEASEEEAPADDAGLAATSQTKSKSMLSLPDLSKVADDIQFVTSGITPMAATSAVETNSGITIVNNMLEHKIIALKSKSSSTGKKSGTAMHYTRLRTYYEPSHPVLKSWPKNLDPEKLYIENRVSPEYIKDMLETKMAGKKKLSRSDIKDLADDIGIYQMTIFQEGADDSGEQVTRDQTVEFAGGQINATGAGGIADSCHCAFAPDARFNAGAAAPILIIILLSSGSVALARARAVNRRRRRR